jgi:hypothetical protein
MNADDLADLLSESLRERTERTDYPTTPMATVTARAGRIRARRRRTTVLAAAAAVAAVAIPGAVWLGRSPSSSPSPIGELSSGPTSSPTQHSTPSPGLTLSSLSRGAKPGVDYLVGDTYVAMGGSPTTAPAYAHALTAALGRGGILVTAQRGDLARVSLVSGRTSQVLGCGAPTFAIGADRTQTAYWLADSCVGGGSGRLYTGTDNTMSQGGPGYRTTPPGQVIQPVGFAPSGVVVNAEDSHGGDQTPRIEEYSGSIRPLTSLQWATGSSQPAGLVSGISAAHADTGVVIDSSTGTVVTRVPHWTLGQFSSDGKYVLGYRSNLQDLAVFDASTGAQVARLGPFAPHTAVDQIGWDSGDDVLAVVTDGHRQAVVRFDLHGRASLATSIRAVSGSALGYRLATLP